MRDTLDIVVCDVEDCDATFTGPARTLPERAQQAGWQVQFVLGQFCDIEDVWWDVTDRCPDHPAAPYSEGRWIIRVALDDEQRTQVLLGELQEFGCETELTPPDTVTADDPFWRIVATVGPGERAQEALDMVRASDHVKAVSSGPEPQPKTD